MTKNNTLLKNAVLIICLIAAAVTWRIINHNYNFAPNLELITTASVIAAVAIGLRGAMIVPIASMVISDVVIGNTSIFVFTWSSFAIIGALAILLRKLNDKPAKQVLYSIGFAAGSSFLFFLVTNFGVWAEGWYPATWAGLVSSYTLALPFYRTMLIGNLILVPTAIAAWQIVKARQAAKSSVVDSLVRN